METCKVDLFVILGNPILRSATDPQDVRSYQALRKYLHTLKNIEVVGLLPQTLTIKGLKMKRSIKYPKNAGLEWVFDKVKEFDDSATYESQVKRCAKRIKPFLRLADDLLDDGATAQFIDDDFVVRLRTYEGRAHNVSKLPQAARDKMQQLIDKSNETQRLKALAEKHGVL